MSASTGFIVVQPNQAAVAVFVGSYVGTVHRSGFIWTWPLIARRVVSLRVQNFDSQILKVNDAAGNPVEVAAVVVWRVVDTAKAVFDVEKLRGLRQDPDRDGRAASRSNSAAIGRTKGPDGPGLTSTAGDVWVVAEAPGAS